MKFTQMLDHIARELEMCSTVFGVSPGYRGTGGVEFFGRRVEVPLGPEAGVHTRFAQSLAAAYVAGARFFPLAPAAETGEYIKGHFILRLLARELGLGDPEGFLLHMTLDAGQAERPETARFLAQMEDARRSPLWDECREAVLARLGQFNNLDRDYVLSIPPVISRSATLRFDAGMEASEVERAAVYLMGERGLHVLAELPAEADLAALAPALTRLRTLGDGLGRAFGVKLPGGMAPADAVALALAVVRACPGVPIAYAGGADAFNVGALGAAGLWPITVRDTLLKPGGYIRFRQMARALSGVAGGAWTVPAEEKLRKLLEDLRSDPRSETREKVTPQGKLPGGVPLLDCFTAPCEAGCPFGQDITGYLRLMAEGRNRDALRVVLDRNPLPRVTGAICQQPCQSYCARRFYDEAVDVRGAKTACAQIAWGDMMARLEPGESVIGQRVAIIGGGPAGMAAAFLLRRRGVPITLFEREDALGGMARRVIPRFRLPDEALEADVKLLDTMEADVRLGTEAPPAPKLLRSGYSHVIVAVGAPLAGLVPLEGRQAESALTFLETRKKDPDAWSGVRDVVVLGGGRTAMDAARSALEIPGVEHVTVAYRRTARYMGAPWEDYQAARRAGADFLPLVRAAAWDGATLTLRETRLGENGEVADGPGTREIKADLVVCAAGRGVDGGALAVHGAAMDASGRPILSRERPETPTRNIFIIGDAKGGPFTVAHAIADAHRAVEAILGPAAPYPHPAGRRGAAMGKKGKLVPRGEAAREGDRCLECATVCEFCVDACPNRANVPILVLTRSRPQILHLDALCTECGTCAALCPYDGAPYREKFTLFDREEDFAASENPGFVMLDFLSRRVRVRLGEAVLEVSLRHADTPLPPHVQELMETVFTDYPYLLGVGRG